MASFKAKFPVLQELFAKNHSRTVSRSSVRAVLAGLSTASGAFSFPTGISSVSAVATSRFDLRRGLAILLGVIVHDML